MDKLKELLGLMPEAKTALGHAGRERVTALKKLRTKVAAEGFDPKDIDAELELWKGTKEARGMLWALDVSDAQEKKADPLQADLEDEKDFRTWELNTDQVRELVAAEISERPAAEAIRILNALEDGEGEKEPKPRKSILDVLRAARKPLVEKVAKLSPGKGGGGTVAGTIGVN